MLRDTFAGFVLGFYVPCPTSGKGLFFQILSLVEDRFSPAEVDVVGRDVAQGFVVSLGVIPADERPDLTLQLHRRLVHIEIHPLLATAMISLDLPVGLRMVRAGQDVTDPALLQIRLEVAADQRGPTIGDQPGPMLNVHRIQPGRFARQLDHV